MTNDETGIRLTVHDASRLEWVAVIPLADQNTASQPYAISFDLQIPAQLAAPQDHWRNLQVLSRLQSPLERVGCSHPATIDSPDALRELALAVAHRAKVLRQAFARECFMANSLLSLEPNERRIQKLIAAFDGVRHEIAEARKVLDALAPKGADVLRERRLVEEFLSNQILDFLFHARRAIDAQLLRPNGPHTEALHEVAHGFEAAISQSIRQELIYREQQAFLTPTSDAPEVLERYLERSSLLKKHFHELLFLNAGHTAIDNRVRDWGAVAGAMAASFIGFGLNIGMLNGSLATAGVSIGVAATLGAAVYALQDRIKEMGKTYVSGKLGKYYAQRSTKLLLPDRRGRRDERFIATYNESFRAERSTRPDLLNPELGATQDVIVLKYDSHGATRPQPELNARGFACMKQVYRFDMSWLLSRLDDALKSVPVLHREGAVRLAAAPRCYRVPVSVSLCVGGVTYRRSAVAVLHKRGLERLEMDQEESTHLTAAVPAEALA